MSNFIDRHLIEKIYEQTVYKQNVLKHDHFFYFDEPIQISDKAKNSFVKNKKIDRINRWNPYLKEEIMPTSYYCLGGSALMQIYDRLKSNKFYIYKKYLNKSHKMRIKESNDFRP